MDEKELIRVKSEDANDDDTSEDSDYEPEKEDESHNVEDMSIGEVENYLRLNDRETIIYAVKLQEEKDLNNEEKRTNDDVSFVLRDYSDAEGNADASSEIDDEEKKINKMNKVCE